MQDKPVREQDSRASFGEAVYAAIDRQDFEEAFDSVKSKSKNLALKLRHLESIWTKQERASRS
jgi:hypothetical protein